MSTPPNNKTSPSHPTAQPARTLLMVHGGSRKPGADALAALWLDALAAGLERDYADAGGRGLLDGVPVQLIYYGDLIDPVLANIRPSRDPVLDLEDRHRDLLRLAGLSSRKKFRRVYYETLPGKSALPELVADVAVPVLNALRLSDPVMARKLPALAAYLTPTGSLRDACETRVLAALAPALLRGDNVLLLSHAMGSVVTYDALWRLTHDPAATEPCARVHSWITFGAPLASAFVKQRLRGATDRIERRYPDKVINWYNVAAEDDFYCHDKTVTDDFSPLLKRRQISHIRDFRIYNLAIRYGRSNPHNAVGYLIHPRFTQLVADWLTEPGR